MYLPLNYTQLSYRFSLCYLCSGLADLLQKKTCLRAAWRIVELSLWGNLLLFVNCVSSAGEGCSVLQG
jgi:hypothetical protein